MWLLIFWMSSPYGVTLTDAKQPTLAIHSQEFTSEQACKAAFQSILAVNNKELTLRGVCTPRGTVDKGE